MSRVLVVSRNPAMAMGLSSTDYEVVDLRPPSFGAWIDGTEDVDALILDLESPALAAAAVANLRAHGKLAPVLLVSSDRPGWDGEGLATLAAAEVLPLPISRPVLLIALEDLLGRVWAVSPNSTFFPPSDTASPPDLWPNSVEPLGLPRHNAPEALSELHDDAELFSLEDDLDGRISPPLVSSEIATPSLPARAAELLSTHQSEDAGPAAPPLSAVPRTRRSIPLPAQAEPRPLVDDFQSLREPHPASAAPLPRPGKSRRAYRAKSSKGGAATTRPAEAAQDSRLQSAEREVDPINLVRDLARTVHLLYGVPETADVVAADAVMRTHANAGAVVVPDAGVWRVAGGVDLRPMEHRYELHAESWLVREIAMGRKGAIIEESDVARERLQGAPLASWRHLLVAPVPEVDALLILARRDDPGFTERDLSALATLGQEAAPLLAAAIDTRDLARTLWEFRDETDLPR